MIPLGTRFIGIAPTVNLTERKSASINAETQPYTLDDIRGYKVFTALLTQSGESDGLFIGSGDLTIGVTYLIDVSNGGDWTNVGAPNNNVNTSFIATGTTPNSWGDGGNLIYNTGAPVVTVLENTIGNIWFTYNNVGSYSIISDNLFTNNKTTTFGSQYNGNLGVYIYFTTGGNMTSNEIPIQVGDPSPSDGYLLNTPIEIRVYN